MEIVTAAEIRSTAANLAPLESQKEYRHRLSEFIRMHSARVYALDTGISPAALPSNSMMIIAQTGCGKSYTATRLAEAAGVKLITIDCSSLTLAGYKGCNLGDLICSAYNQAEDKAQFLRSIILFDEIDKTRLNGVEGNPQVNFLKLFDGMIQSDNRGYSSCQTIDTTRMSFLFAGAFAGLENIIRQRLQPRSIGFCTDTTADTEEGDLLAKATMADIRDYGFMEELLGRIGTLCYIPPLTLADYRTLIKGTSGSTRSRCNNLLQGSGVTMDISDSACAYIAREAGKSALGARAVEPIVFSELKKALSRVDEDARINHVALTCRNDHLALRYSQGARVYPEGQEPKEKPPTLPDVSIANYLSSPEGIEEFCTLALTIFNQPRTVAEGTLNAFLRCTLLIMSTLSLESDKVLSSLTKLARATDKDGAKASAYDRIINEKLKKTYEDDFGNRLSEAYNDFKKLEDEDTCSFLTKATLTLRQKWYQSLLDDATCA